VKVKTKESLLLLLQTLFQIHTSKLKVLKVDSMGRKAPLQDLQ
jgi:hypothetical protein